MTSSAPGQAPVRSRGVTRNHDRIPDARGRRESVVCGEYPTHPLLCEVIEVIGPNAALAQNLTDQRSQASSPWACPACAYDRSRQHSLVVFGARALNGNGRPRTVRTSVPPTPTREEAHPCLPALATAVALKIAAGVREVIKETLGGLSYGEFLAGVASVTILGIGAFMALDELAVAPRIVDGLFTAILAIVAGSAIVAIGGSGIQPLRQYWERSLARMEEETQNMKNQSQGAKDRIKGRAQELKDQAKSTASDGPSTRPPSAR